MIPGLARTVLVSSESEQLDDAFVIAAVKVNRSNVVLGDRTLGFGQSIYAIADCLNEF